MTQNKGNPFGTPSDEVVTEDNTFSIDLTDQTDPNVIEEGDYIGKLIGHLDQAGPACAWRDPLPESADPQKTIKQLAQHLSI